MDQEAHTALQEYKNVVSEHRGTSNPEKGWSDYQISGTETTG